MSAGSDSFSLETFRQDTDHVGRSVALPETEIIDALVGLRNSQDPLADVEARRRLSVNTAHTVATGQRLADYIVRHGLYFLDGTRDVEDLPNPSRAERRQYAAMQRAQARMIRRQLPEVLKILASVMPRAVEMTETITALVNSGTPFKSSEYRREAALLMARIDFVADLLRNFLSEAELLDLDEYRDCRAAMKDTGE